MKDYVNSYSTGSLYESRRIFSQYIDYTGPMSYDQWMRLPEDYKAVALFVQYFDQITLAWYKSKSFYADEEEAVETILQYLMKNVPIIEANRLKFTPNYIYRVAYNCLYCISHDRKSDRERWELECSNIVPVDNDELDLFDTVVERDEDLGDVSIRESFWRIIDDLEEDVKVVVQQLLGGGDVLPWLDACDEEAYHAEQESNRVGRSNYRKLCEEAKRSGRTIEDDEKFVASKKYVAPRTKRISEDRYSKIIVLLQEKLGPYKSVFLAEFSDMEVM